MTSAPLRWPFTYSLTGNNSALTPELITLLTGCGWQPTDSAPCHLSINIYHELEPTPLLANLSAPVIDWRDLIVRRAGPLVQFDYYSTRLQLDLELDRLNLWGSLPTKVAPLIFREFFLRAALLYWLRRKGLFEAHSGAAAIDGHGYLLLGASGSGKTSALLALIQAGWQFACDDAILLTANRDQPDQPGQITVYPLRRHFSLTADTLANYPELQPTANEIVPSTDKRRFDPHTRWPAQAISTVIPEFIIRCRITDQERSEISPLPRTTMLTTLIESTPWLVLDRETAASQLEIFRALAKSCYSFQLSAGRDLRQRPQLLAELLDPERLRASWQSFER